MNINLEIKRKEKQNKSNYLNIIMYFRGRNIEECDHYFECIKQNLNNTFVNPEYGAIFFFYCHGISI